MCVCVCVCAPPAGVKEERGAPRRIKEENTSEDYDSAREKPQSRGEREREGGWAREVKKESDGGSWEAERPRERDERSTPDGDRRGGNSKEVGHARRTHTRIALSLCLSDRKSVV